MKFLKGLLVFISIVFFMLIAYAISNNFFEPKAYNFMVKNFTAIKHGSDDIVIIVIDDKSIGKYRWPWKRNLYCKIFDYLSDYTSASVVINDAIFTTPDKENPNSDFKYFKSLSKMDNLVTGFDLLFTKSLYSDAYDSKFYKKFGLDVKDKRSTKYMSHYKSLLQFPEPYFQSVKMVGSVKMPVNADSFVRSVPYLVSYKDKLYPSLALRTFSYLNGNEGYVLSDDCIIGMNSKIHIPRNYERTGVYSLLKFYKHYDRLGYTHKTYSAIDIMDSYDQIKSGHTPTIHPSEFSGKIVFVGANVKASATGLSDVLRTPVSNEHSGADIQATALDNLVHRDFMYQVRPLHNFLFTIVLVVLTYALIRKFSLFVSATFLFLISLIHLVCCGYCFYHGYAVSVITPLSLEIITMIFGYSHRFILEGRNKEKIQNAMGKYISEDIMKSVVKNIDELKLGGKKANVTVLFSDIRGFTSMSEKLSADEVSVILNEYFTEMEPIVTKHHGVINKFIGDAVMVIFGEPIQDEFHAINAVRCADEMLKKVDELQLKWLSEGKPKIEIGVGINTGEVFVGNIGSENRMEYTVIGDTVNLASRIESYNKTYKTNFLISSSTYACVKNIVDVIKISNVTIRGKSKKMDLYEVISLIG